MVHIQPVYSPPRPLPHTLRKLSLLIHLCVWGGARACGAVPYIAVCGVPVRRRGAACRVWGLCQCVQCGMWVCAGGAYFKKSIRARAGRVWVFVGVNVWRVSPCVASVGPAPAGTHRHTRHTRAHTCGGHIYIYERECGGKMVSQCLSIELRQPAHTNWDERSGTNVVG